ncbi:hypothetical protein [Paenibacillus sp. MMO-58]|uniref:hypothetical protein n=1 Tax=Paenibacillus sp. MMO-58 TaxID=3081290 RepID=UPI0030171F42
MKKWAYLIDMYKSDIATWKEHGLDKKSPETFQRMKNTLARLEADQGDEMGIEE